MAVAAMCVVALAAFLTAVTIVAPSSFPTLGHGREHSVVKIPPPELRRPADHAAGASATGLTPQAFALLPDAADSPTPARAGLDSRRRARSVRDGSRDPRGGSDGGDGPGIRAGRGASASPVTPEGTIKVGGSAPTPASDPPGLAKKGGVPPGLAKKGGVPPGLAKKDGVPPGHR